MADDAPPQAEPAAPAPSADSAVCRQGYLDKCRDFLCEPVGLFLATLDAQDAADAATDPQAFPEASDPVAVSLSGSNVDLFTGRLSYMQVFSICDSLSCLKALKVLDLSYNNIDDAGAKAVARGVETCKTLRTLSLRGNDIGPAGIASIVEALNTASAAEDGATLATLDVNGNPLTDEGGVVVAKFLETNTTLQALDVGNCEFGDVTVIAVCAALCEANKTLNDLNLENPRIRSIEDETSVHVAKMLARNNTLTALNLGKHRMRDHGCHTLVDYGLTRNATLRKLNLRCNELTEMSGAAIHRLLTQHPEVTWLDLSCNRLATRGVMDVAQALPFNYTLDHLDVRSNGIESDGIVALAENALRSTRLTSLRLWGNHIGVRAAEAVMQLVTDSAEDTRPLELDVEPYEVGDRVCVARLSPNEPPSAVVMSVA